MNVAGSYSRYHNENDVSANTVRQLLFGMALGCILLLLSTSRATAQSGGEIKGPFKGICWVERNVHSNGFKDRIRVPCPKSVTISTETPPPRHSLPTSQTSSDRSNDEGCYEHSTIYITGGMNIRTSASVNSAKAGFATAGQSFSVLETRQGKDYCWLRVSNGWIAKTGRVKSEVARSTKGIPPIYGSAVRARKIEVAFTKLHDVWYSYVVEAIKEIRIEIELDVPFYAAILIALNPNAKVAAIAEPNGVISVSNEVIGEKTLDEIASVLIHESCHIYQFRRNRRLDNRSAERECLELELKVALEYYPNSRSHIRDIKGYLQDMR